MRPLRLTLEGFRSHRGRTVLDFEGRSLLGIVGPNGSGKSSILDGVAYALYGRTPSDGRGGQKLINARAEATRVELWFRADEEVFRVTRLQRRRGATQQALERWDAVDGAKLETVADKKSEIGEAVEDLVGLDFDAFARSALLAQNRFAELLTATPSEAARVLTGLFGFAVVEEMRRIADRRLGEVEAELRHVTRAEDELTRAREDSKEVAVRVEEARAEQERLALVMEKLAAIDESVAAATSALEGANADVSTLEEALAGVADQKARDDALETAAVHAEALTAAREAVATARSAEADATEAVDAALADDLPGAISRLAGAIERSSELARRRSDAERTLEAAARDLARAIERKTEVEAVAARSTERAAAAREEHARAREALSAAERGHAAHLLAEGLVEGDACPVCAQIVSSVPSPTSPDGLEGARSSALATEAALGDAESAMQAAHADVARAESAVEAAEATLERATAAADEAAAAHEASSAALGEAVEAVGGSVDDPLGALGATREQWEALQGARKAAAESLREAERAAEAASAADPAVLLADLVDAARPSAALLGVTVPRDPAPEALSEFFTALDEAAASAREAGRSRIKAEEERLASARSARTSALEEAGVDPEVDPAAAHGSAGERLAAAAAESRMHAARIEELERLLRDAERTARAAVHLDRLRADLAPGKFPQYLLDERRRGLADHGSEHLEVLSGGRYRFVLEDNVFKVRDLTAADVVRDADTLSGGELFLASLALALGLATLVGLDRGTLEAFFIDEGFGSLDDDSLELAMDGLERMAASGDRLVVVVSHVPEMRERIGDLVELSKDPLTNDTVVIRA